jgi:glucan phosphoethanolaminetransferase (alkaline phosphatase superfamily)
LHRKETIVLKITILKFILGNSVVFLFVVCVVIIKKKQNKKKKIKMDFFVGIVLLFVIAIMIVGILVYQYIQNKKKLTKSHEKLNLIKQRMEYNDRGGRKCVALNSNEKNLSTCKNFKPTSPQEQEMENNRVAVSMLFNDLQHEVI